MKRVVIFGSNTRSLTKFRGALLKEMSSRGCQVIACAPEFRKDVIEELNSIGVQFKKVCLDRVGTNIFYDLYSFIQLLRILKNIKPDVFIGYTIKPVVYGSLAAQIAGVPRIYSIISGLGYAFAHAGLKSTLVGFVAIRLYSLAMKFNHRVFFQNPDDLSVFQSKRIINNENKAVLVNGSGVDISYYEVTPYPKSMSFLLIARLIKEKGIYDYIDAARIVRQKYPSIRFRLVGFIDKNPSAISEHDLMNWVNAGIIEYQGFLQDVRSAISNTSVYILPSYYPEGTPRSVLEAMSMGRPIITTDTPGCRETVRQGENGFLVPVKNVPALVNAIEKFVQHPNLVYTMGPISRQIAEDKYDVHKVNSVMLKTMELKN